MVKVQSCQSLSLLHFILQSLPSGNKLPSWLTSWAYLFHLSVWDLGRKSNCGDIDGLSYVIAKERKRYKQPFRISPSLPRAVQAEDTTQCILEDTCTDLFMMSFLNINPTSLTFSLSTFCSYFVYFETCSHRGWRTAPLGSGRLESTKFPAFQVPNSLSPTFHKQKQSRKKYLCSLDLPVSCARDTDLVSYHPGWDGLSRNAALFKEPMHMQENSDKLTDLPS